MLCLQILHMGFTLSEGVGGGNTGIQETKLDACCVICIMIAQVINIPHAKWDESPAQDVFPVLPGDLGHTSGRGNILGRK